MGCDVYYLDQFREAVADKISEENAEKVAAAEELMLDAKLSMKALSERTAKFALDLAFIQIQSVHNDDTARVRLIRYAVELCRKAKDELPDV